MKTKRLYKSTVSLLLVFMMLVSMFTVGIVNTTAAEIDTAQTGDYTNLKLEGDFNNWDKSTDQFDANGSVTVDISAGTYLFRLRCTSGTNSGKCYSSGGSITDTTNKHFFYDTTNSSENCTFIASGGTYTFTISTKDNGYNVVVTRSSGGSSGDDSEEKIEISFLINSDTKWVSSDDAKMFIKSGSDVVEMDETVDTKSGHVMWTAEVAANSSYTFYRTSYFFDETNASTNAWNSWTASSRGSNTVFKATSSTGGSWGAASTVNAADPKDIENFWDDLWIDTRGEGNPEHAVKVYYTGSTFHLYVPSYVDLSNVTVYSDHEKVVIGGTEYASGTKANLSTGTKTFKFKDGSTTTNKGNITIYQTTGTAAMLMTTKEELYTGTTAGLASDNAWPTGSGITSTNFNNVYKDAIETKGSYYFYDEEGNIVNSDPVLKKIKGRGNSSFEASMKLYGKYAYNFNLDTEVALVDNATPAKKWCLLANNVDHSMLRNTFAYNLANDIGLAYSPKTRHVDVYDNGEYLGAYTIIEKVEYGDDTLMNGLVNLDDVHEGWYDDYNEAIGIDDYDDYDKEAIQSVGTKDAPKNYTTTSGGAYKYKYWESKVEGFTYEHDLTLDQLAASDFNFVLEHELSERYYNEASWFKAPSGQYVVVKYPEFATQKEMKWAMEMYDKMHQAAYTTKDIEDLEAAIDVESFAKVYLIQELGLNLDSCATSYYMYNQGGKLVAGPVWDYDWSFGSYHKQKGMNGPATRSNTLDNPNQMFVRYKDITNTTNGYGTGTYNLQAQLTQTTGFWTICQSIWTNDMVPAIKNYIDEDTTDDDDTGIILGEWLTSLNASAEMNNIRWNDVYSKDEGALGDSSGGDGDWGTKLTADYDKGSYNFQTSSGTTSNSVGSSEYSYANTVYYLNDWLKVRMDYMSDDGGLYDEALIENYEITDVTFTADQSDDGSQVTVTPSATVTCNGVKLTDSEVQYTVYLNGNAVAGPFAFTKETTTINLTNGMVNEVYVKVSPVADSSTSFTSSSEKFSYGVAVEMAQVTINFKSSGSLRYQPKIKVNGNDNVDSMTKVEERCIGKNSSQTQAYYWYTATVELELGKATNVTFTNAYSMNATIAVTPTDDVVVYHFAVDNLNNGTTVVDLSQYYTADESDQAKLNFKQSASHMVYSSAYEAEPATTSINGTVYKLGDSDGDGIVTVLDATTTQMALAKKIELSAIGSAVTDYDLDGVPSIMDATLAQTYLAQ